MITKFSLALRQALIEEMQRDPNVVLLGEDIGASGGAFKVTDGLLALFGEDRIRDTPISENAIVGCAVGAAMTGLRPVVEIQFDDFLTCAMDQICNQAAKMHFMSGGNLNVPLVIRTPIGATGRGAQHSQSLEAWFMHTPGLKVVLPATPYDAKGLLKSAIRDNGPVLFFEHKLLYGAAQKQEEGPGGMYESLRAAADEEYLVPLGVAEVTRKGSDVTIVATGNMLHKAMRASWELAPLGIDVEIVDPRTLVPLDKDTILESIRKTGRLVIASEDPRTCGVASEISALAADEGYASLKSPVKRVCVPDTPVPFAPNNEREAIPQVRHIVDAVKSIL